MKSKIFNIIVFLVLLINSCQSPTVYKNFEQYKSEDEIAIIQMDGYEIKLKDNSNNVYYDKLYLLEGKYLIEFRDRVTMMKGAVLCEVSKGKFYIIKITDKKNFAKYNKSIYVGTCLEKLKEEPGKLEKYLLEKKLKDEAK